MLRLLNRFKALLGLCTSRSRERGRGGLFVSFLLGLQSRVGLAGPIEGVLINSAHGRSGRGRLLFSHRRLRGLFRLGLLGVLGGCAAIEPVVNHGRLLNQPLAGALVKRRSTPLIIRRPCSSL